MKKPDKATSKAPAGSADQPLDKLFSRFPHVTEYLVTSKWEDGTARDVSALSVSIEDGAVNLALNDKDLKQSAYTRAETLAEALSLLEEALKAGAVQWRPWNRGKRK